MAFVGKTGGTLEEMIFCFCFYLLYCLVFFPEHSAALVPAVYFILQLSLSLFVLIVSIPLMFRGID
jgi:hypothetical protein